MFGRNMLEKQEPAKAFRSESHSEPGLSRRCLNYLPILPLNQVWPSSCCSPTHVFPGLQAEIHAEESKVHVKAGSLSQSLSAQK